MAEEKKIRERRGAKGKKKLGSMTDGAVMNWWIWLPNFMNWWIWLPSFELAGKVETNLDTLFIFFLSFICSGFRYTKYEYVVCC